MSTQVDEALDRIRELVGNAERKLVDLGFEKVKADQKIEELERELALAQVQLDELDNRLALRSGRVTSERNTDG